MFENLSEVKQATIRQLIFIDNMGKMGVVNWIDYADNGDILVNWEDGDYGQPKTFRINRKGLIVD